MKRINDLLDIFSADPGEVITVTVCARNTVFMATHSGLSSGGDWSVQQAPAPGQQCDVRTFVMPAGRESFSVLFQFSPPAGAGAQSYQITLTGADGSSAGTTTISRSNVIPTTTLGYVFTLAADANSHFTTHLEHALAGHQGVRARKSVRKAARRAANG